VSVASVEADLAKVVGDDHVLVDPDLTASFETDFTRRFSGRARCVVRPESTVEVAGVLRVCSAYDIPVVVQGGNTGLVGGGVPTGGEVLLSTTRLQGLGEIDTVAGQVTVGAGVTLSALQEHVRPAGFDFGVDFAARESATIGGLVATNAGGEKVIRYGSTRASVAGLEAVFADGTVTSRLAGLPKDNTGYDLAGLLAGSEGTLAVITAVRLRLVPLYRARTVALLGVGDVSVALAALAALKKRLPAIESAELFLSDGLALVREQARLPHPMAVDSPAYLLVEVADRVDPSEPLLEALADISASVDGIADAVVGQDAGTRHKLWRYREAHTESVNAVGVPVKLDVAVPLAALSTTVEELPSVVAKVVPATRTIIWGHLNEGNLHVNILGVPGSGNDELAHAVESAVLGYVTERGGSISAEHGVGRAKTAYLSLSRSPAEISVLRAIKSALDPQGLLNRGVLLP